MKFAQVVQFVDNLFSFLVGRGCADNRAFAVAYKFFDRVHKASAQFLVVYFSRYAHKMQVGHIDKAVAHVRHVRRDPRPLFAQGGLYYLDHNFVPFFKFGESRLHAVRVKSRRVGHNVFGGKVAVAFKPAVYESRLHTGQNVFNPALVHVAHDRAVAAFFKCKLYELAVFSHSRLVESAIVVEIYGPFRHKSPFKKYSRRRRLL